MSVSRRGKYFHYRFMIDGIRYSGSTHETQLGRARKYETAQIRKIREEGLEPRTPEVPVLRKFAAAFLTHIDQRTEAGSLKPKTRLCYHNGCRLLEATRVWGMQLDRISRSATSELKFPGSGSNANQALRTLRRLLSYAKELGILFTVPRIDLREEHGRDRVLEPWMEALIIEHAPPTLRDVVITILNCGMRPEEAGRMEWEHIRWAENTVLVPHGKSLSARRFVGLTKVLRGLLEARQCKQAKKPSAFVFPGRGKSGHVGNFTHTWARTIARCNKVKQLPSDIVLYSARHTFATQFLRNGGDIGTLARVMGHSDLQTTQRYLHLVEAGSTAAFIDRHNKHHAENSGGAVRVDEASLTSQLQDLRTEVGRLADEVAKIAGAFTHS